ncbi:MAG: glycosyltransferase family 2 protein, partial [Sulfurovum sp.]|nr:glycosyltransferase family 2 protein [Sulfurovaceae bacterium]
MLNNISIIIIAKNADLTIEKSLNSVKEFDEVILYLNHSTDATESIAKRFKNVTIIHGEFMGFGKTKNWASSYSSNNWVLSLDSDELITPELSDELKDLDLSDSSKVYALKMDEYFLGYKLKFRTEKKVRLYNRVEHKFDNLKVHENIEYRLGDKITLKHHFKHLHINTVNQTLEKTIRYTDISSNGKETCYFIVVITKP